ncbi:MAG: hypothetical protein AB8B50_19800 [Pirellulaceae bacterium]
MHALQLTEVAACFARYASSQVSMRVPCARDAVHAFWLGSRYRHDVWSGRLAAHRQAIQTPSTTERTRLWFEIMPTLQEIFLAEPLTRCIAQLATVLDEHEIDLDFAPLARSALTAHTEARNRCLHFIVFGQGLPTDDAVRLNRLRKACEKYTDWLLASLPATVAEDEFSFDPLAVTATRESLQENAHETLMRMFTTTCTHWFIQETSLLIDYREENARQNRRIADSVLQLWPKEMFDSLGLPISKQAAMFRVPSEDRSEPKTKYSTQPLNSPLDLLKFSNRRVVAPENSAAKRF